MVVFKFLANGEDVILGTDGEKCIKLALRSFVTSPNDFMQRTSRQLLTYLGDEAYIESAIYEDSLG